MAGKIPVGDFNARTSLDGTQPIKTLAEMKRSVGALTNEWKAQVAQLKSTGNSLGAAEAKYNGLGKAIDQQKDYLEKLKREQKSVDQTTDEGSKAYSKLSNDIAKAETKIASLTSQQTRAKQSMDYYKSGLADAQSELKRISSVSDSYVKRLRAEGKETEANKKEIEGLKSAHSKMSVIYEKQVKEQAKIASTTGKSSEAYAKQTIRVNETAAKMATAEKRMNELNDEIKKANPSPFSKIKSALTGVNSKAEKTHSLFKTIFSANILSSAVSTVWGKLSSSIGSAKDAAMEYATAQQTMNATWLTLTGNAKEGKKMVDMTNEMAVAAANSTDMVDSMNQKFYAITKNADVTKGLTKSVLTLQDAFGATDDAVMNFSTQFAQMQANGKVSAQDMMSFVNTFPVLRTELLKTMQSQTHNSKLTMSQMNDLMSKGKISAKTMDEVLTGTAKKYSSATENFAKTVPGLSRTIKSQMPVLIGNITQPLLKLKNPVLGALSSWITDPNTHKKFTELGTNFSKELNKVITSFTGKSGSGDAQKKLFDVLNGSIDKFNKAISVSFDYISKHAGDIKGISSDLWTIAKTIGGAVWDTFKDVIKVVGSALGVGGKNAKSMKDPLKTIHAILDKIAKNQDALRTTGKILAGIFIAKKALSFAGALGKVFSGIKNITSAVSDSKLATGLGNIVNGSKLGGIGQSIHSAGGLSGLSTAGKFATGASIAGIGVDAVSSIVEAFTSKDATKKFKAAGSGIGTAVGGGIGLFFGGPLGAAVGSQIGKVIGSWGGVGAKKFTDGWNKSGKGKKPDDWLGALGWDAKQMTNKVAKWWKGVQKTNEAANIKQQKEQAKQNKAAQKQWNSFWSGISKGWSKFWSDHEKKSAKNEKKRQKDYNKALKDNKKAWDNFWSGLAKGWNKYWDDNNKRAAKQNAKRQKEYDNAIKKLKKSWSNYWSSVTKSWNNFWGEVGDKARKGIAKTKSNIDSGLSSIKRAWNKGWSDISSYLSKKFNEIKSNASKGISNTKRTISDGLSAISKAWSKTWKGLGSVFGGIWSGIKKNARKGMQGVLDIINGGISAVNKAWKFFTGKNALSPLHFATGGVLRNEQKLIMVNDDGSSNFKELLEYPNGTFGMFDERNKLTYAPEGTRVYNGRETKSIMNMAGIQHYATGGIVGKLEKATQYLAHPTKMITDLFKGGTKGKSTGISGFNHLASGIVNKMLSSVVKWFKKGLDKVIDKLGGGPNPGGAGVDRWKPMIRQAAAKMKVNLSAAGMNAVLRRIRQESNGNPTIQNNWDSNAKKGTPSVGLLQYIQPTLSAWVPKGVAPNLKSGWSQLMALFNDSNWLRDISVSGGWGPTGHKRFANGGLVGREQLAHVAEGNRPEMIIPLSSLKSSRGYELLGQTAAYFASRDNLQAVGGNDTQLVSMLAEKLDNIATLMMNLSFAVSVKLGDKDLAAELAEPVKAIIDQKARFENQWKRKI